MSDDVKELIECAENRLNAGGDMLIRTMKEQIEQDGKRIAELERRLMNLLAQVAGIEDKKIAAAEAMKEAALTAVVEYGKIKWADYKVGDGPNRANPYTEGQSDAADDCEQLVRALSASEVVKGVKS